MSFHRWMTGFVLVMFMLVALAANAVLFSARSFQHNLSQIVPESGGVISITALEANDAKVQELEQLIAPQRGRAVEAAVQVEQLQAQVRVADEEINAALAAVGRTLGELEARKGIAVEGLDEVSAEMAMTRIQGLLATPRLSEQEAKTVDAARIAVVQTQTREEARNALFDQLAEAEAAQRAAAADVADAQRQILGLKAQFGENYDRIRNEAFALKPLVVTESLVSVHPTFLSTILVLLMGALGAVLFLFPAYLSQSIEVTFVVIIVRIVFGMVTALAFYIVANATLAGFTLSAGGDGTSSALSLNPFTVSLLGIIAGIMADDIAGWIHARGRDILGGGKPAALAPPPADEAAMGPGAMAGAQGLFGNPFQSAADDAATRAGAPQAFVEDNPPPGGYVQKD